MAKAVRWVDLPLGGDGAVPTSNVDSWPPWQCTLDVGGNSTCTWLSEVVDVHGGVELALEATSESQDVQFNWGDSLAIDLNELYAFRFDFRFTVVPSAANAHAVMGLASEEEPTASVDFDTIPESIWLTADGDAVIEAEADDNVAGEVNNAATGLTAVANTWYSCLFAFKESVDGLADIRIYLDKVDGPGGAAKRRRVASGSTFTLNGYTAATRGLQPFFGIEKSASTAVGTLQIANTAMKVGTFNYDM